MLAEDNSDNNIHSFFNLIYEIIRRTVQLPDVSVVQKLNTLNLYV